MFQRILVPLDGSRFGLRALQYAIEIARRFGAEIILLQVIKPATPLIATGVPGIASPTSAEVAMQVALEEDKRNSNRAKRYLSGKVRSIKAQGVTGLYSIIFGDPAQSIMAFSRKGHIDLIVMSTHGKSGFKRTIMGSVADAVIRESGRPVLAIRPRSRGRKHDS